MYLNSKDVAKKLQCTKMTISRMVKRGSLKPINNDCRYFLFDAKDIECLTLKHSSKCNK